MSGPELVPAGWLSAPDLLGRVSDALCGLAPKPLPLDRAQAVGSLMMAEAMARPRPGLAGFIDVDGWHMVPGQAWGGLADDHLAGGADLLATFRSGRCAGALFGAYAGHQLLFSYAETMVWLQPLLRMTSAPAAEGEPPWGRSARNRTPWLESQESTSFADAQLVSEGKPITERGRRVVFEDLFSRHRLVMSAASIESIRNRSGWPIRASA